MHITNLVVMKKQLDAGSLEHSRIAIVSSIYNNITDNVRAHCIDTLKNYGANECNIEEFNVPGVWEIPVICQKIAMSGKFQAIIVFGTMILDTFYLKELMDEVTKALMQISVISEIPVINEIIVAENMKHAKERLAVNDPNRENYQALALIKTLTALGRIN